MMGTYPHSSSAFVKQRMHREAMVAAESSQTLERHLG